MKTRLLAPWACLGAMLCLAGSADAREKGRRAAESTIDYDVSVMPEDPFSDANQAGHPPGVFKRGEIVSLTVRLTPHAGFHTYPFTQRSADPAQLESGLSKLTIEDAAGLSRLWPPREDPAQFVAEKAGGVYLEHPRPFSLTQDFLIPPDAAPGRKVLRFRIEQQVCNDRHCVPEDHTFEVPLTVENAPAVASDAVKARVAESAAVLGAGTVGLLGAPLGQGPRLAAALFPKRAARPLIAVLAVPAELQGQMTKAGPAEGPVRDDRDRQAKDRADRAAETTAAPKGGGSQRLTEMTLWGQLLWTMGGALTMIFTPCVFPMIPVTVSFFLKQSERKPPKPAANAGSVAVAPAAAPKRGTSAVLLASVYSGTIVVVLTAAVLLLGSVIIGLANNPWLNVGFGVLLMVFALSLFGMYEIELPSFLSRFTASREGRGGLVGAVFMALTFTITSFTCTGPFLGVVLAPSAATTLSWGRLVLLSLVYAVTFAAPFFLLALFPGLLKKLPKSGGWLNSVKVVMGFIEVAAALKFLSIADVTFTDGNPRWFTHDSVLCAWIALSALCGLYLLGFIRLPHDTPLEYVGVPRLLLATGFIALALYLTPNLWRANSAGAGTVGEGLAALLPPDRRDLQEEAGPTGVAGKQPAPAAKGAGEESEPPPVVWRRDYEEAWELAVKEHKLLFIDFTGLNCVNCRYNEKYVFARADVQKALSQYVCVRLYTDRVPGSPKSTEEAARNFSRQNKTFEDTALPLYVVFKPDLATPEVNGRLQGKVLADASGKIEDPQQFLTDVLRAPLAAQQVARAD
jgi:thiol:disulfide interchange protein DsbD